jgi:hypothetical protein
MRLLAGAYAFTPGFVPMSPLFKIPEEATSSIFVSERLKDKAERYAQAERQA